MEAISDEDETFIDENDEFTTSKGKISKDDIIAYGGLDLKVEEDLRYIINHFPIYDNYMSNKVWSNLDYDTGDLVYNGEYLQWYNTDNRLDIFKQAHCFIGKPEKVIIYRW